MWKSDPQQSRLSSRLYAGFPGVNAGRCAQLPNFLYEQARTRLDQTAMSIATLRHTGAKTSNDAVHLPSC